MIDRLMPIPSIKSKILKQNIYGREFYVWGGYYVSVS